MDARFGQYCTMILEGAYNMASKLTGKNAQIPLLLY